ncbi:ATP-binding cassette domain-containing protein [Candidatus Woesearchaeota archaeon]|nr:ATP-binding cassette domain-containing protein [Candidatus Woesearchaeota archaeon]
MPKKSKQSIIKIENVWKTYTMGETKVHALRGMNFQVKEGEFVAIMGPSGSGKSTAVNMIGCLDVPTKGEIYLERKNIAHLEESELAQIRGKIIGFIFQQFNLIPTLTAKENIMLPMIFQGVPKQKRLKRAEKLLREVGLKERMDHRPTELSGGQQQRVAIARSLANDPDVILADEPTGNLDSKTGKIVMEYLNMLHKKEKKTIIMVTHDKSLSKFAERKERLKDGKII